MNRNRALLLDFAQGDDARYRYAASVFPSLGANSLFVGGDDLVLSPTPMAFGRYGRFCVVTLSDVQRPSELFPLASARGTFNESGGGGLLQG